MLRTDFTSTFAKDAKRCRKKHWDISQLDTAIRDVVSSDVVPLPFSYNDHSLTADWRGHRELHIGGSRSNWILIYFLDGDTVVFTRTGTHDEVLS